VLKLENAQAVTFEISGNHYAHSFIQIFALMEAITKALGIKLTYGSLVGRPGGNEPSGYP
jgi:hypothetical protein